MTYYTEEEVKSFITAALGDVAEPSAFTLTKIGKRQAVILQYTGSVYVSIPELKREWNYAVECNPRYKDLSLFIPME